MGLKIEEDTDCDVDNLYDDLEVRSTGSIHSNYKDHQEQSKKMWDKKYRNASSEVLQSK